MSQNWNPATMEMHFLVAHSLRSLIFYVISIDDGSIKITFSNYNKKLFTDK